MSYTSREAFELRIAADPYDLVTRKVFADWLEERGLDDEAVIQRSWTKEKQDAIKYMMDFAESVGLDYDDCISGAEQYLKNGDYFDTGCNLEPENAIEEDEFWAAYELISGKPVDNDQKHNFFICDC